MAVPFFSLLSLIGEGQ